jgi:hypothetical protein
MQTSSGGGSSAELPNHVPGDWPPHLKQLRKAAVLALKCLDRPELRSHAQQGAAQHDALLKVMRAMADPRKTLSVYVAMTETAVVLQGRQLSDEQRAEGEELRRGFAQEPLTDEERRAVESLARKRNP